MVIYFKMFGFVVKNGVVAKFDVALIVAVEDSRVVIEESKFLE